MATLALLLLVTPVLLQVPRLLDAGIAALLLSSQTPWEWSLDADAEACPSAPTSENRRAVSSPEYDGCSLSSSTLLLAMLTGLGHGLCCSYECGDILHSWCLEATS